jgi:hypothetical protein
MYQHARTCSPSWRLRSSIDVLSSLMDTQCSCMISVDMFVTFLPRACALLSSVRMSEYTPLKSCATSIYVCMFVYLYAWHCMKYHGHLTGTVAHHNWATKTEPPPRYKKTANGWYEDPEQTKLLCRTWSWRALNVLT